MNKIIFFFLSLILISQSSENLKDNKLENKVIVSFTTYKNRLLTTSVDNMIKSILNQTVTPFKIVMTLYKDDVKYITSFIESLINKNIIELLICNEDLKPHKKYFYVMQKYRDYPIITFDDDIIYENNTIESLINSYKLYPNCISARRVHKMTFNRFHRLKSYSKWRHEYKKESKPSFTLFATNGAGSLFPPHLLNISNDLLSDIYKCLNADDVYLKYLEIKNKIKTVYVKNDKPMGFPIEDDDVQENALYYKNYLENENDIYIKLFNIVYYDEKFIFLVVSDILLFISFLYLLIKI